LILEYHHKSFLPLILIFIFTFTHYLQSTMKLPSALTTAAAAALLIGNASAFSGQMAASEYILSAQLGYGQSITLTDYYTGSQYYAWLYGGFNGCVDKKCSVQYVLPSLRVKCPPSGSCWQTKRQSVIWILTGNGYRMRETTAPASYKFDALLWKTDDGCHNIDFQGGLDAHHGYCCGSLPCDFTA
jgi:hypothetical protein